MLKHIIARWKTRLKNIRESRNPKIEALLRSSKVFARANVSQAAAGMAYYAFFSLFPLLLLIIAILSYILRSQAMQQEVLQSIQSALPVSQKLVQENIQHVLDLRGPVTIVGSVTLLWSASGFFSALVRNVNRAWTEDDHYGFVSRRLVAFSMVLSLALLLLVSLIARTALNVVPTLVSQLGLTAPGSQDTIRATLLNLMPFFLRFIAFLGLYRLVPADPVSWTGALGGAAIAFGASEGITYAFTWYVTSGTATYELIYGSLGRIVALMFWIYLSSWTVLVGAHVSATIDRVRRAEGPPT